MSYFIFIYTKRMNILQWLLFLVLHFSIQVIGQGNPPGNGNSSSGNGSSTNGSSTTTTITDQDLITALLTGYDSAARPVADINSMLDIKAKFVPRQPIDIDERTETLTINLDLRLSWKDVNLNWDPAAYGNTKTIVIARSSLWEPHVRFENRINNLDSGVLSTKDPMPRLVSCRDPNICGEVEWVTWGELVIYCPLSVRFFPFDSQTCQSIMSTNAPGLSLKCDLADMNYMQGPVGANVTNTKRSYPGQWQLVNATCRRQPKGEILFTINLVRDPLFYISTVMIPCTIISILSICIFLLPSDAGERVSLGITLLLTYTVFLLMVSNFLPKSINRTPVFVIYLDLSLGISSASLLCSLILMNIHHMWPDVQPPACMVRIASCCCAPPRPPSSRSYHDNPYERRRQAERGLYGDYGRSERPYRRDGLNSSGLPSEPGVASMESIDEIFHSLKRSVRHSDRTEQLCDVVEILARQQHGLLAMQARKRRVKRDANEGSDEPQEEDVSMQWERNRMGWGRVARCIDWILFVIFLTATIVTGVALLVVPKMINL